MATAYEEHYVISRWFNKGVWRRLRNSRTQPRATRKNTQSTSRVTLSIAMLFSGATSAEFHVWYDIDGMKQVSTHPQSCFNGPHVDTMRPECDAWRLSPEQTTALAESGLDRERRREAMEFSEEL